MFQTTNQYIHIYGYIYIWRVKHLITNWCAHPSIVRLLNCASSTVPLFDIAIASILDVWYDWWCIDVWYSLASWRWAASTQVMLLFCRATFPSEVHLGVTKLPGSIEEFGRFDTHIYLPIYLSIYLSIYRSIYLSIYLSTYRSVYLSIYLFIYLSMHLIHVCMYVCMYACIYIYMYVCMYIYIYTHYYTQIIEGPRDHLIIPMGMGQRYAGNYCWEWGR